MVDSGNVTVRIDEHEVRVPAGTLIIRAAEDAGVFIPRFCDHRLLAPVAACRQCLVEVEGQRKPVASCAATVTEGMVVRTQETSVVARSAQRSNLEFLLINHPLDCPMCDKGGECPLQDQTLDYGPGETRFVDIKRRFEKPIKIGETVLLDRDRCVQCARCTRFSAEIADDPFIELFERGALEQVAIFADAGYRSYFSGNVVQICPVGALTSPSYRFQARPFDLASTDGVCNHCASGCNLRVDARRGQVTRQLARDNDEVNEAWNCDRGRYGFASGQTDARLTAPLARAGDGELQLVGWGDALRRAGEGLAARRPGVGVLMGGHLLDEDAYALQKLARVALGTNNVDARSWRAAPGESALLARLVGTGPQESKEAVVDELGDAAPSDADVHHEEGARLASAVVAASFASVEEARVIVVVDLDPHEESPILYLRIRKAVLRKGARLIVIGSRAGRLARLGEWIPTIPGEAPAVLAALGRGEGPAGQLLSDPGGRIVVLAGWRAGTTGALQASMELAEGCGAAFGWVPRRAGDRGALEVGARPDLLPGGRSVVDAAARAQIEALWSCSLPQETGMDTMAMLEAAARGDVGALLLVGVDPLRDLGPRELVAAALQRAFVVVIDQTLSETTSFADVVLPATLWSESTGTVTDWEGRIQQQRAAVAIAGAAQRVWELADQLAIVLGTRLGVPSSHAVERETRHLRRGSGLAPAALPGSAAPSPGPLPPGMLALVTYPLLLDDASLLQGAVDLEQTTVGPFVEVHPDEATRRGVVHGQRVEVAFGPVRVQAPLLVSEAIAPGCLFVPTNQPGLAFGGLVGAAGQAIAVTLRALEEVVV